MDRYKQLKIFLTFILLTFSSSAFSLSFYFSSRTEAFTACMDYSYANYTCVNDSTWYVGTVGAGAVYFKYNYSCPVDQILNSATGGCDPVIITCESIGFNPDGFYPDGFCPNAPSSNSSSSESSCLASESVVSVPSCTLKSCSNGSLIASGFLCPEPYQCWDGSIVYGSPSFCPDRPILCSNGSYASSLDLCPNPNEETKTCWDGSVINSSQSCPNEPNPDNPDNPDSPDNPNDPENPFKRCLDGSLVSASSICPELLIGAPVGDSQTTTSDSTTIHSDGSTSTTTTTETIEINLDGLNSRLDNINQNTKDTSLSSSRTADNTFQTSLSAAETAANTFDAAKAGREIADYMSEPFTDSFTSDSVSTEEIPFTFAPVSLASGGGCPAPQTYSMSFGSMSFNNQPICDFANGINGIVLSVCSMIGVYILIGGIRNA